MKFKGIICFIVVLLFYSSICWGFDQVFPETGKVALSQTDHHLRTPAGPLPILRSYRSCIEAGIMGPGWSFDIVSYLDRMGNNLLIITQAGRPTLLVQKGDNNVFEGPGNVSAHFKDDQWVVASPAKVTSIYDIQGREISRRDANGNNVSFSYDKEGRLSEIEAVKDYPLKFRYDSNGLVSSIQDADGRQSIYRYDTAGRLVEAQDANFWKTTYRYGENRRLTEAHYPSGIKVNFSYDKSGRVSKRVSSSGITYRYSYGKATRITRQDDFWWETEYDKRGLPLKYHDSLKREQSWSWNNESQLIKRRFLDGSFTIYTYDRQGRMVKQETNRGDILEMAYDGASSRPAKIDHNGAVTRFTYDKKGNPLSVISPAGRKTVYQYDQQGRRLSVTDGEGRTTRFEYDLAGNRVKQINPDNGVISWKYDKNGQVSRRVDPLGNVTSYAYQSNGLLDSITLHGGERISYRYDGHGRLIEETIRGLTTRYSYDQRGSLVRIDYPDETYEEIAYDPMGKPVKVTDVLGREIRQEFDPLGRVIRTVSPSGLVMSNAFDPNGKMEAVIIGQNKVRIATEDGGKNVRLTDSAGRVTRLVKDQWGRVILRTFPGGGQEQRQYDPDGFLQAVTLPMGDTWRFRHNRAGQLQEVVFPDGGQRKLAHDAAGRIAAITYPSGKKISYRYSSAGLLLESINARGQKVEYQYDQSGRVIHKQTPNNIWNYRYDARGNLIQTGNGKFTVRYYYDHFGRLTQTEYPEWGKAVKYEYDKFGRVSERTDPDENQTRYIYDKLGSVSKIEAHARRAFTFSYDDANRLLKREAANGTTTGYNYDDAGRVISIVHRDPAGKVLAEAKYRYDVDGNRVEMVDKDGKKSVYRYDQERRLTGETGSLGKKTYAYGPGGKRSSVTVKSGAVDYRYDQAGRLVQAGDVLFSYDADGNMVSRKNKDGTTRYFYDSENNLIEVELPGGKAVSYGYGPFGERIWREEDGKRIHYLLDGDNLLQELSTDFKPEGTYIHAGLDRPLMAFPKNGDVNFFHQDDLGSVLAISDGKGKVFARNSYDAFGNIMKQEQKDDDHPLRFTGRPLDSATGLYDLRARFYEPELGQFTTRDPIFGRIDDPVTLSPYAYARNNPLGFIDPFGKTYDPIGEVLAGRIPESPNIPPGLPESKWTYTQWKADWQYYIAENMRRMGVGQKLPTGRADPNLSETGGVPTEHSTLQVTPQPNIAPVSSHESGSGWWQGIQQRVSQRFQSEWQLWKKTGPSAQSVGYTAGLGNIAMALADIAAEPLAAYMWGDDATAEVDEAAQNLTGLAIGSAAVGLGTYVTGGLLVAAAPAAAPVLVVGGAIVSGVGLAYGAGNRLGTLIREGQAWEEALEEEAYNQAQADQTSRAISASGVEIIDSIESKISKIKTLIGGDINEIEQLEREVGSRKNHATAKGNNAENMVDSVKKLDEKIKTFDKLLQKAKEDQISESEAESRLGKIEALARQACDHENDDDGGKKARELSSQVEQLVSKYKDDVSPNTEFYAAKLLAKEIANTARNYIFDAEDLESEVRSDLLGINQRISLIKGTAKNWQHAKKLYKDVRRSLSNLQQFSSFSVDLPALRQEFNAITLPKVKDMANATKLLSYANESKEAVEQFLEKLSLEKARKDAAGFKNKGESEEKKLEEAEKKITLWIERANAALARANECAQGTVKKIAKVLVVPGSVEMSIGEKKKFTAMGVYVDGTTKPISAQWPDGNSFTATTTGTHTIRATYQGKSGHATITVKDPDQTEASTQEAEPSDEAMDDSTGDGTILSSMQLAPGSAKIEPNGSVSFTAIPISTNGNRLQRQDLQNLSFEWSVNDPSVANISGQHNQATLTPIKEGTVIVICVTAQANAFATVIITEKRQGSTSENGCEEGYVRDAQTGECVPPFDENYTSRNQLMEGNEQDRQRETIEQNIADANLDPNEGKYNSDISDEEIKRMQEAVSAECGPQKPCSDPDKYTCVDGKCVKKQDDEKDDEDHHEDESSTRPPGEKPPPEKSQCSPPCSGDYKCVDGKCKKKEKIDKKPDKPKTKKPKPKKPRKPRKPTEPVKYCPGHTFCTKTGTFWDRTLDVNKDGICDLCKDKISKGHRWIITWPDSSRRHCPERDK